MRMGNMTWMDEKKQRNRIPMYARLLRMPTLTPFLGKLATVIRSNLAIPDKEVRRQWSSNHRLDVYNGKEIDSSGLFTS